MREIRERIREELDGMRVFDVHTHLGSGGRRQARNLADIASYHWLATELVRAAERRFSSHPHEDPEGYLDEVAPHFAAIRQTSNHYAFMGILRDLYGFDERTITPENWRRADEAVRSHAEDGTWVASVLDRAKIERLTIPAEAGMPDDSSRYVPYVGGEPFFTPGWAGAFRRMARRWGPVPRTAEGVEELIGSTIDRIVEEQKIRALHVWHRGTWKYAVPDRRDVETALVKLARREDVPRELQHNLMSFAADCTAEAAGRNGLVIQLFHGMGVHATGGRDDCTSDWDPEFVRALATHFAAHQKARYDVFLGTRIPGHETASLARVHPNLMVSGGWWHAFTPTTLGEFFRDRLEMLPTTAWNAFYSDGYVVEWIYGKLLVTKNRLAHALAGMVDEGFMSEEDALDAARKLLYENAARVYCGE